MLSSVKIRRSLRQKRKEEFYELVQNLVFEILNGGIFLGHPEKRIRFEVQNESQSTWIAFI